jgi:hypothetical protein
MLRYRISVLLLALVLAVGVAACGDDDSASIPAGCKSNDPPADTIASHTGVARSHGIQIS